MTQPDNFAEHNIHLETERLILRPFKDADFYIAVPFYNEPEFLEAMEGRATRRTYNEGISQKCGRIHEERRVSVCDRRKGERQNDWRGMFAVDELGTGESCG